jgi:hypothetical protein
MDITTHSTAGAWVGWIGRIRAAVPGAIALGLIAISILAWAAILDRALSALP